MSMRDGDIQRAAEELVGRHGANASAVAQERADELVNSDDQAAFNLALRVLTAVEQLMRIQR
ncbi:MAG: hypothetical protein WAN51_02140 [Alphaproteobacteria bacterium]